jgi:hypothetical protein
MRAVVQVVPEIGTRQRSGPGQSPILHFDSLGSFLNSLSQKSLNSDSSE